MQGTPTSGASTFPPTRSTRWPRKPLLPVALVRTGPGPSTRALARFRWASRACRTSNWAIADVELLGLHAGGRQRRALFAGRNAHRFRAGFCRFRRRWSATQQPACAGFRGRRSHLRARSPGTVRARGPGARRHLHRRRRSGCGRRGPRGHGAHDRRPRSRPGARLAGEPPHCDAHHLRPPGRGRINGVGNRGHPRPLRRSSRWRMDSGSRARAFPSGAVFAFPAARRARRARSYRDDRLCSKPR